MKASELVEALQYAIDIHGDVDVEISDIDKMDRHEALLLCVHDHCDKVSIIIASKS